MYCCEVFFSHVILQNLIICRITWVFSLKWIDQSAKNYAHNTFLCQNHAFNDAYSSWHQPQFEVLCTNALHANVYKTIHQRFMQHNSDIEHVTHLGYQTQWDQNVRRIVQLLNPYFARLNERHNVRIIHNAGFMRDVCAIQVLYGTYTQGRFCTGSPIPQVFYGPLWCLPKHLSKFQLNASNYYPPA